MGGVVKKIPGGEVVESIVTGKPTKGERPNKENYENPYEQALMERLLGAIDSYNEKRFGGAGIKKYTPTGRQAGTAEARQQAQGREMEQPEEDTSAPEPIRQAKPAPLAPGPEVEARASVAPVRPGTKLVPVSDTVDPELRRRALQQALKQTSYAPNFRR